MAFAHVALVCECDCPDDIGWDPALAELRQAADDAWTDLVFALERFRTRCTTLGHEAHPLARTATALAQALAADRPEVLAQVVSAATTDVILDRLTGRASDAVRRLQDRGLKFMASLSVDTAYVERKPITLASPDARTRVAA